MTTTQILATLQNAGIVTLGDLDAWARARRFSRWQALAVILGVSTADRVLGALIVKFDEMEAV
jgi:hypothetical protein